MASSSATAQAPAIDSCVDQYDAITRVMNLYVEGVRTGDTAIMKPAFHENAGFFGYYEGKLLAGPIQLLFDVTQQNGPSGDARCRITSIDLRDTIAVVALEMENYTGKLAGEGGNHLSDLFSLIKVDGAWKITQKSFRWHA